VKIHPAIGIARVGNSELDDGFFYAPEVPDGPSMQPGFYKDGNGAIKRQAARFRVYGYDSNGKVVKEITEKDGYTLEWAVHLANKKASWFQFHMALDIEEAKDLSPEQYHRRNKGTEQKQLIIDPGARSVDGPGQSQVFEGTIGPDQTKVYLGELRTDPEGRLIVLGGRGKSEMFLKDPDHNPEDPANKYALSTFGNNDGWHDDVSDGPVTVKVTDHQNNALEVKGESWVIVGPPNYAPDVKGVITLYDLLYDLFVQADLLPKPQNVVFERDILPLLRRFSGHQWVNRGFAGEFGWGGPHDFTSKAIVDVLGSPKERYRDQRERVFGMMRNYARDGTSPVPWPWLYGDAMETPPRSVRQHITLTPTQEGLLEQWVKGNFTNVTQSAPATLDEAPIADQPGLLDRAALEYCLADAFHPGCEVTWPIRHLSLYAEPFRIRHLSGDEQDFGDSLPPAKALAPGGPVHAQPPGGLTRWMAVPWQTDTASCRAGYELRNNIGPRYSPYLPSFWPARVPNHVLKKEHFDTVNSQQDDDKRAEAFEDRAVWYRFLNPDKKRGLADMIKMWHQLGIVEAHDYTVGDGKFPSKIWVESKPTVPDAGTVPDHQNLCNIQVLEAGNSALSTDAVDDVIAQAVDEAVERTGFAKETISAGYVGKIDPFLGRR
jgi:hypothetical protein